MTPYSSPYLHALGVNAGVPEGDVTLLDDLLADSAPCRVVTLSAAGIPRLHVKLLPKPFLTELAPGIGILDQARNNAGKSHLKQVL